jgi:3-carboxy-cis,cis-muconate cycloisomerase
VAASSARACARRAPGLVATLLAAMEQELERAAGAWHTEWPTLCDLLAAVGSAAAWLAESLRCLRPDTARMAANVAAASDPRLAGAVTDELAGPLGRAAAHEQTAAAVRDARHQGRPLADVVRQRMRVDVDRLLAGLQPDVGEAGRQVDKALAEHERFVEGAP